MNEDIRRTIKDTAYYLGLAFANRFVARIPFFTLRRWFYCSIFRMQIAPGAFLAMDVRMMSPWKIQIGRDSVINTGCLLDGRRGIVIGANVTISWDSCILTLQHDPDDPMFSTVGAPVHIEDDGWIATRATILPGVRVGKGAIVGTSAVVTKDVDDFTIVAGNPARPLRKRSQDLRYTPKKNPFFDWAV